MSRYRVLDDDEDSNKDDSSIIDDNTGEDCDLTHVLSSSNHDIIVHNSDDRSDTVAFIHDRTSSRQEGGTLNLRTSSHATSYTSSGGLQLDIDVDDDDLSTCCRVITALAKNAELFKLSRFRPLRTALDPLVKEQLRKYGNNDDNKAGVNSAKSRKRRRGGGSDKKDDMMLSNLNKHDDKDASSSNMEELDRIFINKTQLRAARLAELDRLNEEQSSTINVPRIPDGCATNAITDADMTSSSDPTTSTDATFIRILHTPLSCYICHKPYIKLHFFYSQLCPDCAVFNYMKRDEQVDLTGYICLVTGGRTKIGYRSALKLLRCGATVIVTTRFLYDCLSRYKQEHDWMIWSSRLHAFALDFRDLSSLESFCQYIDQKYTHIDAIVNNAAQTVRRPASYYAHLLPGERNAHMNGMLNFHDNMNNNQEFWTHNHKHEGPLLSDSNDVHVSSSLSHHQHLDDHNTTRRNRLPHEMSQMMVLPSDDVVGDTNLFPAHATDVNRQQVDLRQHNSWTMRLHEISTAEMAEVMAINAIAPTVINSKLKPALERSCHRYKFIVNVSAMEGKFYRYKTDKHPHTNMAKAALNMQTRTSAQDYVKSGIYMTCVDTGWINDEKPIDKALRHQQQHDFQTPIDEIDAAARVLDPIIAPLLAGVREGVQIEPPFGVFLKDYMKCEW